MALAKINDYLQHTLRDDFTSPNPEVRKAAIYALGRLGSGPEVLLILRNIAAEDADPEVRYTAKKALNYWEGVLSEDKGEPERVDIRDAGGDLDLGKLGKALGSARSGLQIAAVIEVVKLGDPAALPALRELLGHEEDPWVLSMAAKALGSLGEREDVPRLLALLEHGNHRVVANTIEALEILGDPALARHLAPLLKSPDNRVRGNAVKAVHRYEPDQAFEALEGMAINHRPWMRASALYCLKVLDDPRCEGLLLEMARKEYGDDLIRELLDAVVAQGSPRSVGVLAVLVGDAEEGERKRRLEGALQLLARKHDLDTDRIRNLADAQRQRDQAERGQRSGMYRVEDVEEDEPASGEPAVPLGSSAPRGGYEPSTRALQQPGEDPGSRTILAMAVGLGVLAAIYGGYRMVFDPPRLPSGASQPREIR